MDFASVVRQAAPDAGKEIDAASGLSQGVADKARVALGRTGIQAAREGVVKAGFLQKRGPLKVGREYRRASQAALPASGCLATMPVHVSHFAPLMWHLQVWQKRWFVLEDGELSYFRSYSQVRSPNVRNGTVVKSVAELRCAVWRCLFFSVRALQKAGNAEAEPGNKVYSVVSCLRSVYWAAQ